jgi:hypothetical protein
VLSATINLVRAHSMARPARWLVFVAIATASVLAAYVRIVRITPSVAPDYSTVSLVAESDSPVCEERPEAPNVTDEVSGTHRLNVARPASKAEAGCAPRLRESPPPGDRFQGLAAAALRKTAASTTAVAFSSSDWGSPRRTHARLMVFLN